MVDIGNVFPGLIFRRCDYRIGEMKRRVVYFAFWASARTIPSNAPMVKILEILKILIQNQEQVLILKVWPQSKTGPQISGRKAINTLLILRHIWWKHFFGQLPVVILFVFVYLLGWSWTMLPSLYRFWNRIPFFYFSFFHYLSSFIKILRNDVFKSGSSGRNIA